MNQDPPPPVQRVAQLASKLAAIDPTATETVRELFRAFAEVQEHYRRPQPIETAPNAAGVPIFLFCPSQRGWHVGVWSPDRGGSWVASIDTTKILEPTHWTPAAAEPGELATTDAEPPVRERRPELPAHSPE